MDLDLEGQSRGGGGGAITSLQTVPWHIAGMLALFCWKRYFSKQSDKYAGHVGEGLHLHSIGM